MKIYLTASAVLIAAITHLYVRKAIKSDAAIEQELNTLLAQLYASTRAGESVVNALKSTTGELAKKLSSIVASSTTKPVGVALSEESNRVKHPFLAIMFYVLGNVVHSTKRFADVLTALIFEYHRYTEYTKLRKSIARTTSIIVLFALVLTAFCMGIVKLQLIPTMSDLASRAQSFYFDTDHAKRIANDMVVILAATTPLVLSSITWDFRQSFKYYILTYAIASAFLFF